MGDSYRACAGCAELYKGPEMTAKEKKAEVEMAGSLGESGDSNHLTCLLTLRHEILGLLGPHKYFKKNIGLYLKVRL